MAAFPALSPAQLGPRLSYDVKALSDLRFRAHTDEAGTMRAAAQQFEALMLDMMLKSMRETVPQEGLLDSDETRLFGELLDQQVSQTIATTRGIGLADLMVKQLTQLRGEPVKKTAVEPITKE